MDKKRFFFADSHFYLTFADVLNEIRLFMKITNKIDERKIIADRVALLLQRSAPKASRAILFGSQARGDAHKNSDWDVLILLNKDRVTDADIDNISYPIRELGWELDEMINPIIYTTQEWESKSFTPFYKNVMKEGVPL